MCESAQQPQPEAEGLSRDDEKVLRILNLLFVLNSTRRPLPTSAIIEDADLGYGGSNRESEKKKFNRDRADLAAHGIAVVEVKPEGASEAEESSWAIDRDRTHASTGILSADDASMLIAALDEFLGRKDLPFALALQRIRHKLSSPDELAGAEPGGTDPVLNSIWTAFNLRKSIRIKYRSAQGALSDRIVAIYGIFAHGEASYLVGEDLGKHAIRTFRVDRIERAYKPSKPYAIPADFHIADYLFFEFDLGGEREMPATFSIEGSVPEPEVLALTRRRGSLERRVGTWIWNVVVRDLDAAAAFALSHADMGVAPLQPAELRDSWIRTIEEAVSAHGGNQ